MIVSGAAPPMVDALRRVRRWMSRRVFCRFCHARSRVPMVFGPFHYCAFCERAAPDAPETIDDQRRCTGCRYRTIYGGSRGSASLPRRRSGSVLSLLQCYTNGSPLTETKVFVSVLFLVRTFLGQEWSAKINRATVDVNASLQSVKALEPEVLSAIERGA